MGIEQLSVLSAMHLQNCMFKKNNQHIPSFHTNIKPLKGHTTQGRLL